jgi:hypothetical protein
VTESNQGDPLVALMALQEALWKLIGEWRGKIKPGGTYFIAQGKTYEQCALELEQILSGCIPTERRQ